MLWFQSPLLCGTVLTLLIESTVGQACQGEKCDKLYDGTNNSPTYQCFRQDFIVDGSTALEVFDAPTVSSIEEILSGYRDGTTDCQFINQFVDSEEYEATVDVEYCCDFEAHDRFTFVRFAYNALNDNRADLGFERARLPIRTFSEDRPAPTMEPVAPVVTPVMVPSPTFDNMPTTKAPSQTATTAPSKAPTISSTKSPVAVPSPTAAPVVAVTSTGRYAQVLQVPEGTTELSEEQQETFTSTIESLEFDEAITETTCSIEDQTLEGTALTVTYQCQYTGSATAPEDYSDYTVDNAEEVASTLADGGLPVEGISAVVDSPVESPVTPPVSVPTLPPNGAPVAAAVPSVAPVAEPESVSSRYVQVFQVPEGTELLDDAEQTQFTESVESLTSAFSPGTDSDCAFDDQTIEGSSLTVEYTCSYSGDGAASAPDSYVEYTRDNSPMITSALADAGLPIQSTAPVTVSPAQSAVGRYVQDFTVTEGAGELDEAQATTFERVIERQTGEFVDGLDATDCTIDDQTVTESILSVEYSCEYTGDGAENAQAAFVQFSEDTDLVTSAMAAEGLPIVDANPAIVAPIRTITAQYSQELVLQPNSVPFTAAQRGELSDYIETTAEEGLTTVETDCVVTNQDAVIESGTRSVLSLSYECSHTTSFRAVDLTMVPSEVAGLVNENLDLLVAENPSLSILEAGPMNQTLPGTAPTMAPTSAPFPDSYVTSSRVFVQTFEIPDGGSELDINEQRKLAGVVEMYANVAAESIVSGSDVESMCIVNDQSLGDDILAVEYLCEMGAEQPVSDVDLNNVQAQTEVELNKDLGIFTTEAQNAGLPIQGAKPIRLVPNEGLMGPPPVLFSDSSSGKYTQSFRVVPENESTIDFSGDQLPELESLLESYATSFVETDTAVNCQVDRQQVSAFELQDGTTSDTDSLLTVDYSCIFESEENDVTTHPQDLIKATNMDLAGFTVSAREIHSDIDETIPLEFRFDQTVASFVQNVTLAQGTGVFSQNESNLFSATISEFYAAEAPTSTVECQAKKQTPYTDSAVAIDYDCLFTATSEAVPLDNEPLQFVRKINRNLEDTADALVGSGLPIQNIDNTRATDRSFVDSARFQQVFRLSPGSTAWGSDEQIAFRDAMASLEFGPYQREASADCSLEYQSILEFDETLLAVDYLCEFEASTDPKEVAPVFGAYLNANPEQVVMALSNEGLPVEEADKVSSPDFLIPTTDETVPMMPGTHQAPEPMPTVAPQPSPVSTVPISPVNAIPTSAPVIASPTSAPVLEIPVVPSTLTPLPTPLVPTTITERYVQGFEVQEGTGEFDEEEEVAFIETIELLASEAAGGMGETNCTIDDQLIQGTVLTVEYSCVYSGTSAEAPSAFRQFTSERSAEFDSTMANAGVPILSSEPALQRESSVAFRQALTLADGVERLSNAEASEFASVASALGPIDTNTECSYTDQAPKGESLELIYLCIFTPASQTGGDIDIASAPLTFARGINRDLEGFSQLLVERGVPVESLEQTRAIGQVFSDSARFQQIVQVEEGSGKWDDDQTESFRNGMAKLDFGPYPGESSALCEVLYQSILEFDDSLLALDYTCVFSTSTDPADTAPLFGEFINANRDLVQNVLSDEGLPVEKVEKVSSPDFLLSSTNGGQPVSPASPSQAPQMESPVMLPSSTSGSQPAVPDSPSQAPQTESPVMLPAPTNGDQPAVPDSPSQAPQTESPVTVPSSTNGSQPTVLNSPSQGTLPTSTATIEFQQVFLRSDNLEVWDTNQEGIFEVEIARLMTNVEENTETECDVVFTSVLEFIPRLLSVDYSCSFASALPIQSAERFGSYINANLEFVAESLSDAGLPVERADPVSSPGLLLQPQSSATSSLAMAIDSSSRETLASWVEFVLIFVALAALN